MLVEAISVVVSISQLRHYQNFHTLQQTVRLNSNTPHQLYVYLLVPVGVNILMEES
jgi:hypothetical protein